MKQSERWGSPETTRARGTNISVVPHAPAQKPLLNSSESAVDFSGVLTYPEAGQKINLFWLGYDTYLWLGDKSPSTLNTPCKIRSVR